MKRIVYWSLLAMAVLLAAPVPDSAAMLDRANPAPADSIEGAADAAWAARVAARADSVRAVARLLVANGAPHDKALPVAAAIMKYSRLREVDPLLVVAIIGVENTVLDTDARSSQGATGVMQIMPGWTNRIHDCGTDLRDVDVNVCFGTRILRMALDSSATIKRALQRYNGCSRGARCERYPRAVFSRAGRAMLVERAVD